MINSWDRSNKIRNKIKILFYLFHMSTDYYSIELRITTDTHMYLNDIEYKIISIIILHNPI